MSFYYVHKPESKFQEEFADFMNDFSSKFQKAFESGKKHPSPSVSWTGFVLRGKFPEGIGGGVSEIERRAARGSREKFDAAMACVPDVPPVEGDEL